MTQTITTHPAIETLIEYPHWVGYRLPGKKPLTPINGDGTWGAKSNDPSTWGTYDQATAAMTANGWDGIGFACHSKTIALVFIDLDHCIEDGVIADWAMEIVKQIDSYSEISPSGNGIHILAYGYIPDDIAPLRPTPDDIKILPPPADVAEIYANTRYFTVTGNHLEGTPDTIEHRPQEALDVHTAVKAKVDSYRENLQSLKKRLNGHSNGHQNGNGKNFDGDDTLSQVKTDVLGKYTFKNLVGFAQKLFPGKTEKADHGGTRILGYGGLIVYDGDSPHWKNFSENIGGDAINLAAYHLFSNHKATSKDFIKALCLAGEYVGIDVDARLKEGKAKPAENQQTGDAHVNGKAAMVKGGPVPDDDLFLLSESADDEGNAQSANRVYAGQFLHCDALGWLAYNGRCWHRQDAENALDRAIVNTLKRRRVLAVIAEKDSIVKATKPSAPNVRNCKALFKSLVAESVSNFDNDPDVLNCRNGVVSLRTGEITPHHPAQRFTYCIDIDYDPTADDTLWTSWLDSAITPKSLLQEDDYTPYTQLSLWLQKAVGYSLTGRTNEQIMIYLHGPGRAGKGLFCQTLSKLLGRPLSAAVDFDTFTAKRGGDSQNFDLAPLRPARLVTASESSRANMLNAKTVKAITGNDPVYCAFKHRDHFEYTPQFKIWLSSNFKIMADADDDALWSRLRVVTFPNSHIGKEDFQLEDKLWQSRAGILAWAVAGAVEWYKQLETNHGLGHPQIIRDATNDHKADNDRLGQFIEECCIAGDDKYVKSSLFNAAYKQWSIDNSYQPLGSKRVTESMQKKGFERRQTKKEGVNLGVCWQKIGLLA